MSLIHPLGLKMTMMTVTVQIMKMMGGIVMIVEVITVTVAVMIIAIFFNSNAPKKIVS